MTEITEAAYYVGQIAFQQEQERSILEHGAWLGGIFEVGGWMSFTPRTTTVRGIEYKGGRVLVQVNASEEQNIKQLKKIIGGNIYKEKGDNSWSLRVADGKRALTIAEAIKPYAPSRDEFMVLADLWEQMSSADRYDFAKEYLVTARENRPMATTDAYKDLVTNPQFLAGVLDGRGRALKVQRRGERKNRDDRRIVVGSRNRTLLEALKREYGGVIEEHITGTDGKRGTTIQWSISHQQARYVYGIAKQHLILEKDSMADIFE